MLQTIIECLKYITTGDMPPNGKGGAFVYDPNIAREREVRAQVKLQFKDIAKNQVTCSRSLLATQKVSTVLKFNCIFFFVYGGKLAWLILSPPLFVILVCKLHSIDKIVHFYQMCRLVYHGM